MLEDFTGGDSLVRIDFQQLPNEICGLLGDVSKQLGVEYIVGVENLIPELRILSIFTNSKQYFKTFGSSKDVNKYIQHTGCAV